MKILKTIIIISLYSFNLIGLTPPNKNLCFFKNFYIFNINNTKEKINYKEKDIISVYALYDTFNYSDTSLVSSTNMNIKLGEEIIVYKEPIFENGISFFQNKNGYIREKDFTKDKSYIFYPEDKIYYAVENAAILDKPNEDGNILNVLNLNDEIHTSGKNHIGYLKIFNTKNEFINEDDLMENMYIPPTPEPTPEIIYNAPVEEYTSTNEVYEYSAQSSGHLTPSAGVFYGPSGKETYYNLDMSGVISIAQSAGINGTYWVRSDGAKMYGDYIMCACGFDVRPRGTIVQTSLGAGICLDTGTFAYSDPYQIDIAVNWP